MKAHTDVSTYLASSMAHQYSFITIIIILAHCGACGFLAPQPGIEPVSSALQGRSLTTGPPGKPSLISILVGQMLHVHLHRCTAHRWTDTGVTGVTRQYVMSPRGIKVEKAAQTPWEMSGRQALREQKAAHKPDERVSREWLRREVNESRGKPIEHVFRRQTIVSGGRGTAFPTVNACLWKEDLCLKKKEKAKSCIHFCSMSLIWTHSHFISFCLHSKLLQGL